MADKKAEQRRIKAEKQAAARQRAALAGLAWKIGGLVVVVLSLVVLVQGFFGAETSPPGEVVASDHVRGNSAAPVTLTVYADFQCPACRTESNLIARAWPRIEDRVRLVFRHYPLDTHRHAFLAARYAEAAARQDAFWEMHDLLFGNQALWSQTPNAVPIFDGYAGELGLDLAQLRADVDSAAVRDKVLADQRGGTRAGVRSTPSLFLNGRLIANPDTAPALVALVNAAAE